MAGPRSTWQGVERRVCALLRLARTPLSGRNGGTGTCGDCTGAEVGTPRGWLYVEVKHRATGFALWKDTAEKAKAERRVPILIQHEKGTQTYAATVPLNILAALIDIADEKGRLTLDGIEAI